MRRIKEPARGWFLVRPPSLACDHLLTMPSRGFSFPLCVQTACALSPLSPFIRAHVGVPWWSSG